jgi:hypothetical protein
MPRLSCTSASKNVPPKRMASSLSPKWKTTVCRVTSAYLLAGLLASLCLAQTKSGSGKPSTANSASENAATPAKSANSSAATGATAPFAIETEIIAYKSLESDSEAIACDIAGFLFSPESRALVPNGPNPLSKDKAKPPQPVARACDSAPSGSPTGVVILSSAGATLTNFQAWRANMVAIKAFQAQANADCPARVTSGVRTLGIPGASIPTPSDIEGLVALFATNESAIGTTGTIKDQALTNGVARQLRALNVSVLLPDSFAPFSLGGADATKSPLLKSLADLFDTRTRLKACADKETDAAKKTEENSIVSGIDSFLKDAMTAPADATPPALPPIAAALTADGFAQAIGSNADGTFSGDSIWKHVLLLNALESGGSQLSQGNLFGSKVHFSGGAVATYALFTRDGTSNGRLTCSGNVYDYGGYLRPKDLARQFVRSELDPRHQLIFLRGGCVSPE